MNNKNAFYLLFLLILMIWGVWFAYTIPRTLALFQEHWPVSVTMMFGSFIAGATSEGGGAIAFPVLTKLLKVPPQDAKVFSLAIQSIGMTVASSFIILFKVRVEWNVIKWSSVGGLLGIIISSLLLAPMLPAAMIKMSFTVMTSSFAMTLYLIHNKRSHEHDSLPFKTVREKLILVFAGLLGGIMSGLVGNGIDIICFSVLVLLFRISESVATPTSVILMAINALFGLIMYSWFIEGFNSDVKDYWLASIPVVIIGAPLGAYCCSRMKKRTIVVILVNLILFELISSLILIPLNQQIAITSLILFGFFSWVYFRLARIQYYSTD